MLTRFKAFIQRASSVSSLGVSALERARILTLYFLLAGKRAARLTPSLRRPRKLRLSYDGKPFVFYLDRQLDFDVLRDIFVHEEYGAVVLEDPKVIFDLGSNIGATVVYFALRYPGAHIVAFEPDPENISRFKRNTSAFSERVTLHERAVYSEDDAELEFYAATDLHWASSTIERAGTHAVSVRTITLDTALRESGVDRIDLLKFDIEGGEYEAFRSFRGLSHVQTLIGELHPDVLPISTSGFLEMFTGFAISFVREAGNPIAVFRRKG